MGFDVVGSTAALIWHLLFFSLAIVEDRWFNLGLLWFLMNCLVLMFLFRVVYVGSNSNRLICWYLYVLSMFSDFLSLIVFGEVSTFRTIMGVCILIVKPVFGFFEAKRLKEDGIDVKKGLVFEETRNGHSDTPQTNAYPTNEAILKPSVQPASSYGRLESVEDVNANKNKPSASTTTTATTKPTTNLDEFFAQSDANDNEDSDNDNEDEYKRDQEYANYNTPSQNQPPILPTSDQTSPQTNKDNGAADFLS